MTHSTTAHRLCLCALLVLAMGARAAEKKVA